MVVLMVRLRATLQKDASEKWKIYWTNRWIDLEKSSSSFASWRSAEAHRLVRLALFRELQRERELALYMTAYLNEIDVEKVDKPDGLVVEYARSFLSDNRDLLASAVLSGGDE